MLSLAFITTLVIALCGDGWDIALVVAWWSLIIGGRFSLEHTDNGT